MKFGRLRLVLSLALLASNLLVGVLFVAGFFPKLFATKQPAT